jgi:hypothetical protein
MIYTRLSQKYWFVFMVSQYFVTILILPITGPRSQTCLAGLPKLQQIAHQGGHSHA